MPNQPSQKPVRLNFKSYIKLIRNSVGSDMFRNFYVKTDERGQFDALDDGDNSCAFYVSSVLSMFNRIDGIHGTIGRTVEEMKHSGWVEVDKPKPGDVLVWEAEQFKDGMHRHIGFYVGDGKAISTSTAKKSPQEHDMRFGKANRKVTNIYRLEEWDD